ncbi:MAG: type II toxin-antitoxin system VapB family antitoxin, partial [Rhodospirillaceae bacterium]|nr:type II toxin-antitoxin system VapB family antitoxin [Rhodospirillaceae bacterium]
MSLNIKKAETHKLARRLAKLTGESMTTAVDTALRERLERVSAPRSQEELAERILAIGRDCAKRWKEPYRSIDHGDL